MRKIALPVCRYSNSLGANNNSLSASTDQKASQALYIGSKKCDYNPDAKTRITAAPNFSAVSR